MTEREILEKLIESQAAQIELYKKLLAQQAPTIINWPTYQPSTPGTAVPPQYPSYPIVTCSSPPPLELTTMTQQAAGGCLTGGTVMTNGVYGNVRSHIGMTMMVMPSMKTITDDDDSAAGSLARVA